MQRTTGKPRARCAPTATPWSSRLNSYRWLAVGCSLAAGSLHAGSSPLLAQGRALLVPEEVAWDTTTSAKIDTLADYYHAGAWDSFRWALRPLLTRADSVRRDRECVSSLSVAFRTPHGIARFLVDSSDESQEPFTDAMTGLDRGRCLVDVRIVGPGDTHGTVYHAARRSTDRSDLEDLLEKLGPALQTVRFVPTVRTDGTVQVGVVTVPFEVSDLVAYDTVIATETEQVESARSERSTSKVTFKNSPLRWATFGTVAGRHFSNDLATSELRSGGVAEKDLSATGYAALTLNLHAPFAPNRTSPSLRERVSLGVGLVLLPAPGYSIGLGVTPPGFPRSVAVRVDWSTLRLKAANGGTAQLVSKSESIWSLGFGFRFG